MYTHYIYIYIYIYIGGTLDVRSPCTPAWVSARMICPRVESSSIRMKRPDRRPNAGTEHAGDEVYHHVEAPAKYIGDLAVAHPSLYTGYTRV